MTLNEMVTFWSLKNQIKHKVLLGNKGPLGVVTSIEVVLPKLHLDIRYLDGPEVVILYAGISTLRSTKISIHRDNFTAMFELNKIMDPNKEIENEIH